MGYNKKVDANQAELCKYIRSLGASICYLHSVGGGCPDILVGYDGENHFWEIKAVKRGKLNELQVKFHNGWVGKVEVIKTVEDINRILGV